VEGFGREYLDLRRVWYRLPGWWRPPRRPLEVRALEDAQVRPNGDPLPPILDFGGVLSKHHYGRASNECALEDVKVGERL